MNREHTTYIATALMFEYMRILKDVFPGVVSTHEFAQVFNDKDFTYQDFRRSKINPDSIRSGLISCSGAAMLIGLRNVLTGKSEPRYFVERTEVMQPFGLSDNTKKKGPTDAHVTLRESFDSEPTLFWELWNDERVDGSFYCFIRNLTESGVEHARRGRMFTNTATLFANRVSTFGFRRESREKLERNREILEPHQNNYDQFLTFLKEQFYS